VLTKNLLTPYIYGLFNSDEKHVFTGITLVKFKGMLVQSYLDIATYHILIQKWTYKMKINMFNNKKFLFLISILLIILLARLVAPTVITKMINNQLENTEGVSGYVEDIDVALFRGAYKIKGLTLYLQKQPIDVPTIYIKTLDLSLAWASLFKGNVVANVNISDGEFTFVDERKVDNKLKEEVVNSKTWLTVINYATPISIDKVTFKGVKATLTLQTGENAHNSYFDDIQGEIINITNSRHFSGSEIIEFTVKGKLMSQAAMTFSGTINPTTKLPTFDTNLEMQRLPVVSVDKLIKFYTPFDIERGDIDAAIELSADNGKIVGYTKVGIFDVNVFSWKEDIVKDDDGLFTGLFEGLADIFANIFEANKKDLLAVNVPISGTLQDTEVSTWQAILSLFHNAFVNAYEIKIDDIITLNDNSGGGSEPLNQNKEPDNSSK